MSFDYKNTGDESGSGIDLYVMDKDGDFAFSPTSIFNTDWTEFTDPLDDASFDPAAGEYVLIYVHAFASGNGSKSTYAGEITLTYQGR